MRTLLSIAQNQALVKQKRPKNYLQSFQEIKTKKIMESLYSETLLSISENQDLVNKKDRETLDLFCVLLLLFSSDFSLDFQSNIFREFCQIKNRRAMSSVPPKYATLNSKNPHLNRIRNHIRFSSTQYN